MGNSFWDTVTEFGAYEINPNPDECLYPEVREQLEKSLKSRKPFDTGWHRFKYSMQAMKVQRSDIGITLSVAEWCDDIQDMVQIDCNNSYLLTSSQAEKIIADFSGRNTREERGTVILRSCTLNTLLKMASFLRDECNEVLEELFQEINDRVNEAAGNAI